MKAILRSLVFKVIILMSLMLFIIGGTLGYLNFGNKTDFMDSMYKDQETFVTDLLKAEKEASIKKRFVKYRDLVTLIITVINGNQEGKNNTKILKELLSAFMSNDGIVAMKIINKAGNIIISAHKEDDDIVFAKSIPASITTNSELRSSKRLLYENEQRGYIVSYFNINNLVETIEEASEIYLEDFSFFKEDLEEQEEQFVKLNIIYFALSFLFILITIVIILQGMVNRPLKKLKQGINDFFLVLQNKTKTIQSIEIKSKDEFGSMAESINKNIFTSLELHNQIEITHKKVALAHKNMHDAVTYSSLIQNALMPEIDIMNDFFKEHFVHWQPKNVVGGDIYFFDQLNEDECIVMCIDCTGHSIPGAFVTMLVKAVHHHIINDLKTNKSEIQLSTILSVFNQQIKEILKQYDKSSQSNAGFDGGVVHINKKTKQVRYCGANTNLYYIHNNKAKMLPCNKYSVGYKSCNNEYKYKAYKFTANHSMKFYITTDGFFDQMGGNKKFRFGKRRFKEMLELNHNKPFKEQKEIYIQTLREYQGEEETNDDISFLGFWCDFP